MMYRLFVVGVVIALMSVILIVIADEVWLVVGASDKSAMQIAKKENKLSTLVDNSLVVQMIDCSQSNRMFAWLAAVSTSRSNAESVLDKVRKSVKDAYLMQCQVKANSLLAHRITAVDSSIADVPANVVNWSDEDCVSEIRSLPQGADILIIRYFENDPEDPLEGRREAVKLIDRSGEQYTLEKYCIDPEGFVQNKEQIAFVCAREQAGTHLLHSVVVFDSQGKKIKEIEYCRSPSWLGMDKLECNGETVGPDGDLVLHPRQVEIGVHKPSTLYVAELLV
ncbi:MAG: hypothetical protein P8163_00205 [Candidatus Thiodiazotropha sp.]